MDKIAQRLVNNLGFFLFILWRLAVFLLYFLNLVKRGTDVLFFLVLRSL